MPSASNRSTPEWTLVDSRHPGQAAARDDARGSTHRALGRLKFHGASEFRPKNRRLLRQIAAYYCTGIAIFSSVYQHCRRNLIATGGESPGSELPDAPSTKPPRIDGRRLRSERTKQLIIEAFLSLLRDNPQMPTAVQIAERAGYSVRSIFERFPDLNALRVAATDYSLAQALALAPPRGADGDRQTRLRAQVNTRAHTCERGIALWRVLLQFADQDETGQLKQRVARSRDTTVGRIELMYRPELSTLPEEERRQLLIALEALTDMESWARMREEHGLSFDEACEVWIHAIDRLLPPTPVAQSVAA
jgi:AcrR family transcriptional regulator